jgi:hypothetical protein
MLSNEMDNPNGGGQNLGEVLSALVNQLDSSNTLLAGRFQDLSQATQSGLANIGSTMQQAGVAPAQGSSLGSAALNVLNPLGTRSRNPGSMVSSLLLGPVWRGIFRLFGGEGESTQPLLTPFLRPESAASQLAARTSEEGVNARLRSDAFGQTRAENAGAAPIQLSIQALDARSILDRSDEIAAAVRQAMLTNHSLNESLTEL